MNDSKPQTDGCVDRVATLLERLYGAARTPDLIRRMEALMGRWRPELPAPGGRRPLPLTSRDALLITYPDQVVRAGERPLRTLAQFARRHCSGVISGIHLLPHYPFTSDDGFAVTDYYGVRADLGGWAEVRALAASFPLMLDGVFNHLSAGSAWFRRFLAGDPAFDGFFVTVAGDPDLSQVVRPRTSPLWTEFEGRAGRCRVWTTFGPDQVDLNFARPEVLLAIAEVMLFYVSQGARYLRLDAIGYLWKEPGTSCIHRPQTHAVVQLLRAVLDAVAPQVLLITETNVPHLENLTYLGDGTNEAQLVYNFALPPLVLHTLLTGNATGLTRWAQGWAEPGPEVTFFNFLASHDGIGLNAARDFLSEPEVASLVQRTLDVGGQVSWKSNPGGAPSPYELNINYLDALSEPGAGDPMSGVSRFIVAHAILCALRGVPGVYAHSLFGSRGDPEAARRSGIPRRINRAQLPIETLEAELSQPGSLRSRVYGALAALLRARAAHSAFHPGAPQRVLELGPDLFAVVRGGEAWGGRVWCLHNVTDRHVPMPSLVTEGAETGWRDLLAKPEGAPAQGTELGPGEVCWLATVGPGDPA